MGQSISDQSEKALPHLHQVAGEGGKEVAQGEGKTFQPSGEMEHKPCFSKVAIRHENRVSLIGQNPVSPTVISTFLLPQREKLCSSPKRLNTGDKIHLMNQRELFQMI